MTSRRKGTECEGVACEHTLGQQPLQLFGYLWSEASGRNGGGKETFSFVLTDTVVFKRQRPVKWFFTSKQERGKILCKTKKFLTVERVLREFLAPRKGSTTVLDDKAIIATYMYLDWSATVGEHRMIVEHLDKEALEILLEEREKPGFSILQRFIPTKSGYNHAVRSVYTPENCVMQKCISPYLLNDTKASVAQRTATFEVIGSALRHRDVTDREVQSTIEKINDEVSSHLEAIVGKEMVRFVGFFKVGADNQVYLMWSSMISFDSSGKASAKNYQLTLVGNTPGGAMAFKLKSEENGTHRAGMHTLVGCNAQLKDCPNCQRTFPRDQVEFVVSHKSIIRHFENNATEDITDEDNIPPLLTAISGPIQAERFKQLKQSADYLYQTVHVCLSCAQQFNSSPDPPPSNQQRRNAIHPDRKSETVHSSHSNEVVNIDLQSEPAKEDETRQCQKPVVVQTRAFSAGSMRMRFSKNNIRGGSHQYRRHLQQFLPHLHAYDPPAVAPRDAVLQLALHLRRNYGHPSLRFGLSQHNEFPVGSMVPLRTLTGICTAELLVPVARYWATLSQAQESSKTPQIVDIDALDGLLAASINPSHPLVRSATQTQQHPRKQFGRSKNPEETADSSSAARQRPSSASIYVPKRPNRPRSCIPTSILSRKARLLSLSSHTTLNNNTENRQSRKPSMDAKKAFKRTFDGVECLVRASARSQSDGDDNYALHFEVTQLSDRKNNQSQVAMNLTLTTAEIIALLGAANLPRYLDSQAALLEAILPFVRIQDAQLYVPSLQHQQPPPQSHRHEPQPSPPPCSSILPPTSCPELSDMERLLLAETLARE